MTGSAPLHPATVQADQPSDHLTSPARCIGLLRFRLSRVRPCRQARGGRAVLCAAYPFHLTGPR